MTSVTTGTRTSRMRRYVATAKSPSLNEIDLTKVYRVMARSRSRRLPSASRVKGQAIATSSPLV